jgi:hypothetical protein
VQQRHRLIEPPLHLHIAGILKMHLPKFRGTDGYPDSEQAH